MTKISDKERLPSTEYQYGFKDDIDAVIQFDKGLNEEVIKEISRLKYKQ